MNDSCGAFLNHSTALVPLGLAPRIWASCSQRPARVDHTVAIYSTARWTPKPGSHRLNIRQRAGRHIVRHRKGTVVWPATIMVEDGEGATSEECSDILSWSAVLVPIRPYGWLSAGAGSGHVEEFQLSPRSNSRTRYEVLCHVKI